MAPIHGFWTTLPRPFLALAPMADVTDPAFRRVIAMYGKPDVMFTQFVSCDGLISEGQKALLVDLEYSPIERPIVAQLFGATPEHFTRCAALIQSLGFDGIDINMGCPDKKVEKQGAGAALMRDPDLAAAIIAATRLGAPELPISIKTRLGYNEIGYKSFLPAILAEAPVAVSIHARTRKEMSLVPARWDDLAAAASFIRTNAPGTLVIGNGDVTSVADAREKARRYGVDGIMVGRGIFGNPWFFNEHVEKAALPMDQAFAVMLEHAQLFEELLGKRKSFAIMKKHFKAYASGFPGARDLRVSLMSAASAADARRIVEDYFSRHREPSMVR